MSYLYLHGGEGVLYFKGASLKNFDKLERRTVKRIYLFSCSGGAGKEGKNIAWILAKKTGAKVIACTGKVSFLKLGKGYYARKGFKDWGIFKAFYYEKGAAKSSIFY